jgi:hypothetical protein
MSYSHIQKPPCAARNAFFESTCIASNGNLIDLTDPALTGRIEMPSKPVRVSTEEVYPLDARRMGYKGKPVVDRSNIWIDARCIRRE